jgi:hypothetical protein
MYNDQQIQGILSNWDKVESEIRVGLHEDFGKSKDIQDILDIIHDLQETANTVSPLRNLFKDHIEDINNPHKVNMSLAELQLLNIMYSLYISRFGVDMDIMEFGYALINIKRFATRQDIDEGIHKDSIINIDVLNYVISKHDTDENAHSELFRFRLPGTPIMMPPSDILEPNISINSLFTVDRNCPINYHDINGRVLTIEANKLPIDFSYNKPACPIFGPHQNILLNSKVLSDVSHHGSVRNAGSNLLIVTPTSDTNFLLLQETAIMGAHGFNDPLPQEITGVQNFVLYYYPIERTAVCIDILASTEILASIVYDCENNETQHTGSITKLIPSIQDLPSGWRRLSFTIDATGLNITSFDVNTLLSIDPSNLFNTTYQGVVCNAGGFWQHQLTNTPLPVPPIFTDDTPQSVLGTKLYRNYSSIYNPIRGTILLKYLSPISEVFGTKSALLRLGQNAPEVHTAVSIETNPFNTKRNRITSYNVNNDVLTLIDSAEYSPDDPQFMKRVVFTYGIGVQGYGFTDQKPDVFRLGITDVLDQIITFFEDIYDGSVHMTGTKILQLPQDIITPDDTDETIVTGTQANEADYRINMGVNVFELGYNTTTDKYLEGYVLNFRYYSVFASEMNIEFLLDQYIP